MRDVCDHKRTTASLFVDHGSRSETREGQSGKGGSSSPGGHRSVAQASSEPSCESGDAPKFTRMLKELSRTVLVGSLLGVCSCGGSTSVPVAENARSEGAAPTKQKVPPAKALSPPPRLVVWLTIDQFRGDYLDRYDSLFSDEGLRGLIESGTWYREAHYEHAITETAPGHATLFTGASPSQHGIVANTWLRADGVEIASVGDESSPLTGPGIEQEAPPIKGRSPRQLMVPTVGDELIRSSGGRAKVIGISSKDRGAILPAGKGGQAFWLGPRGFVSSQYYGETAPEWLTAHHLEHPPESYLKGGWPLAASEETYSRPVRRSESVTTSFGLDFPHSFPEGMAPANVLSQTPFGDTAVLDLARRALIQEGLGVDDVPDLLSLSLSSTDAVGHLFGPESREFQDQLVRLDRSLAAFFQFLDARLGAESVLYVLSADHGGCESVEYLVDLGLPGFRLTEAAVLEAGQRILQIKYGRKDLILGSNSPYLFLDHEKLTSGGLSFVEVQRHLAHELRAHPGVFDAFATTGSLEPGELAQRVQVSIYPGRSGDVYVVPDSYSLFLQEENLAATHGSPWSYDTHVPIVIKGAGVARQVVERRVDVRSLAPTVARLMGTPVPGASTQPLLAETF